MIEWIALYLLVGVVTSAWLVKKEDFKLERALILSVFWPVVWAAKLSYNKKLRWREEATEVKK